MADTSRHIANAGGTASVVRFGDPSTRAASEAFLGGESWRATISFDRKRAASRRSIGVSATGLAALTWRVRRA